MNEDEKARELMQDAVDALAEAGYSPERVREECEYCIGVAQDEGSFDG